MSVTLDTGVFYNGKEVSVKVQDIRDYLSSLSSGDTKAGLSNTGYSCLSARTIIWKYGEDIDAYVDNTKITVFNADLDSTDFSFPIDQEVLDYTDPFDAWGEVGTPHTRDEVYEKFPGLKQPNA